MSDRFDGGTDLEEIVKFVSWTEAEWAEWIATPCIFLLLKLIGEADDSWHCVDIVAGLESLEEPFDKQVCASEERWLLNSIVSYMGKR